MCRMTIYKGLSLEQSILLSDLIVHPNHSIIRQSYSCQERFHDTGLPPQLNADGFGIGWYAEPMYLAKDQEVVLSPQTKRQKRCDSATACVIPRNRQYETPCVFTSVTPAWNNRNLFQLADKVRSPLFFAHVRAASIGSPTTEANCHPFTFDKFLFMHNGGIGQFHLVKRRIVEMLSDVSFDMMQGNTDSEHCFALFLTLLDKISPLAQPCTPKSMRSAMIQTIRIIDKLCREVGADEASLLNFAVSDGETIVASRYVDLDTCNAASLYFTTGSRWISSSTKDNEFIMQRQDNVEKVFIMASERLSMETSDWIEVPKNHIVTVSAEMNVKICPIGVKDMN